MRIVGLPFKLWKKALLVSVSGDKAILKETPPPLPKAPKMSTNMMGNKILNTIALGWAKIALKLALVMAHNALDWLYGWLMLVGCGANVFIQGQ